MLQTPMWPLPCVIPWGSLSLTQMFSPLAFCGLSCLGKDLVLHNSLDKRKEGFVAVGGAE